MKTFVKFVVIIAVLALLIGVFAPLVYSIVSYRSAPVVLDDDTTIDIGGNVDEGAEEVSE